MSPITRCGNPVSALVLFLFWASGRPDTRERPHLHRHMGTMGTLNNDDYWSVFIYAAAHTEAHRSVDRTHRPRRRSKKRCFSVPSVDHGPAAPIVPPLDGDGEPPAVHYAPPILLEPPIPTLAPFSGAQARFRGRRGDRNLSFRCLNGHVAVSSAIRFAQSRRLPLLVGPIMPLFPPSFKLIHRRNLLYPQGGARAFSLLARRSAIAMLGAVEKGGA